MSDHPDFTKIIGDVGSPPHTSRTGEYRAAHLLATKVPKVGDTILCQTCKGTGGELRNYPEPFGDVWEDCDDCPTIADLLRVGARTWSEPERDESGGHVSTPEWYGRLAENSLLRRLKGVRA